MKFDLIFSSFDIQIPSKKVVNAETRRWWKYIGANFWGSGTNFRCCHANVSAQSCWCSNLGKFYSTGVLCQKVYTLKMRKLGPILPTIKQCKFHYEFLNV